MVEVIVKNNPIYKGWLLHDHDATYLSENQRWRITNRQRLWRPPTDVYEIEDSVVIRVEIAGMREADFIVYVDDRRVVISGIRTDTPERRAYHQMEIPFGEFAVEVDLNFPVIVDEVQALYREGFLRVILPKARPQQIHVSD